MKRIYALMLLLLFLSAFAYAEEEEEEFVVEAKAAVLIEASSGRILFALNENEMLPIASTTKIMTCLVALESSRLDDAVIVSGNAYGTPGTSIFLSEGERLTMEQMLYGLMLRSGNDAAVAIAEHVAGSEEKFAAMMNARAQQIGADAHFVNPHGLDAEGHKASALGMALIMREALNNEDFARISSTQKKVIPWPGNTYSRMLQNKNRLLTSYEGATGGKTGFTTPAGRCLVFSAERNGMQLIGVLLNCSAWFDTAETLLDYGFDTYKIETIYQQGEVVDTLDVSGGQARRVDVVAADTLAVPVGVGEEYELALELPESATAPIQRGEVAGRAVVYINGEAIADTNLLYADDVPINTMEAAMKRLFDMWLLTL